MDTTGCEKCLSKLEEIKLTFDKMHEEKIKVEDKISSIIIKTEETQSLLEVIEKEIRQHQNKFLIGETWANVIICDHAGDGGDTWKMEYVTLNEGILTFYKDEQKTTTYRNITLRSDIKISRRDHMQTEENNAIKIVFPDEYSPSGFMSCKMLLMEISDESDVGIWIDIITMAIAVNTIKYRHERSNIESDDGDDVVDGPEADFVLSPSDDVDGSICPGCVRLRKMKRNENNIRTSLQETRDRLTKKKKSYEDVIDSMKRAKLKLAKWKETTKDLDNAYMKGHFCVNHDANRRRDSTAAATWKRACVLLKENKLYFYYPNILPDVISIDLRDSVSIGSCEELKALARMYGKDQDNIIMLNCQSDEEKNKMVILIDMATNKEKNKWLEKITPNIQ